jgi:hypothetical protein
LKAPVKAILVRDAWPLEAGQGGFIKYPEAGIKRPVIALSSRISLDTRQNA